MDWANERYVRVYVRDSRDWLAFGWEGRALFVELLRVTDRTGLVDFAGDDDIGILADQVRMPVDVVERALPRLMARGSVVHRNGMLVVVNKMEACEAAQSGKQRTKESRALARDMRRLHALFGNESLRDSVTKRVASVTVGNDETHRDTPCNPEQSRAEQSRAHAEDARVSAHVGSQLGADVCHWLGSHLGKSFNAASEVVTDAGQDWRAQGWDKIRVIGAVKLRVAQLKSIQPSRPDLTPALLFDAKLVKWIEQFDTGGTVGDYQTGKNGQPAKAKKWKTVDQAREETDRGQ